MIETIKALKQSTGQAETIVRNGCSEIKRLDTAKKNITFSITSLKRLIMLSKSLFLSDLTVFLTCSVCSLGD